MPVPSPRNSIRIARGNYADLSANAAAFGEGEFIYAIDQDRFYTSASGALVAVGAGVVAAEGIDALADVDTSTIAPGVGQVLKWDGTNWVPADDSNTDAVTSVAGKTGAVTLVKADITDFADGDYATAAQGILADSATQPGDNISTLTNDAGYITAAQVPADAVSSVNSQTGAVVLDADDISDAATTNKFTTAAEISKLAGIETGATADQTAAEIRALVESATDSNVFTDADHTKLDGIAAGAQVNVGTDLSYTASTRVLASSTGNDATLPLFGSTDPGLVGGSGGGTTNFLRADGTWASPGGGELQQDAYDNLYAGDNALSSWTGTVTSSNVVIGTNAGLDLTDGLANVLIGQNAGQDLTTGDNNIVIGTETYASSVGATGNFNICLGKWTGYKFTSANNNVILGNAAGDALTTGSSNVALGTNSLSGATTGGSNVVIGDGADRFGAGSFNTVLGRRAGEYCDGDNNIVIGNEAQYNLGMSGSNNILIGANADASTPTVSNEITLGNASITSLRIPGLQSGATNGDVLTYNSTNGNLELATPSGELQQDAYDNLYAGDNALSSWTGTVSSSNVVIGTGAGLDLTDGLANVFIGKGAGQDVTTGDNNIALGKDTYSATVGATGADNIVMGRNAGNKLTSGVRNICLGPLTGDAITTSTGNVLLGPFAGSTITTNSYNVAVGSSAMRYSTSGGNNVVIGNEAGNYISGNNNTIIGYQAQYSSTYTGTNNITIGNGAASSSTSASNEITLGNASITSFRIPGLQSGATNGDVLTYNSTNGNLELAAPSGGGGGASAIDGLSDAITNSSGKTIGLGTNALSNDDGTDNFNTALGYNALGACTTGYYNVGIGYQALDALVGGNNSVAIGFAALTNKSSPIRVVAIGSNAAKDIGINSVVVGANAAEVGGGGASDSTFVGVYSGYRTTGDRNTFIGSQAGFDNTSGTQNSTLGQKSGENITTGIQNVFIGCQAGNTTTTGGNNVCLGYDAETSTTTVSNEITLGNASIATLRCNQTTITSLSDGRDKINVAQLGEGLDFIARLKPVKFKWQTRDGNIKDGTYEAGFIAQDLQQAQRDAEAEYLGLVMDSNPDRLEASYGKLVPVLVRAIQELKAEIDTLKAHAVSQTR